MWDLGAGAEHGCVACCEFETQAGNFRVPPRTAHGRSPTCERDARTAAATARAADFASPCPNAEPRASRTDQPSPSAKLVGVGILLVGARRFRVAGKSQVSGMLAGT